MARERTAAKKANQIAEHRQKHCVGIPNSAFGPVVLAEMLIAGAIPESLAIFTSLVSQAFSPLLVRPLRCVSKKLIMVCVPVYENNMTPALYVHAIATATFVH